MKTQSDNVILRWKNSASQWYLRGIRSDGSFYGECFKGNDSNGVLVKVEGKLSQSDNSRFRELLAHFKNSRRRVPVENEVASGVLAEGSMSRPNVIFYYSQRNHDGSEFEKLFNSMTQLFERCCSKDV